MNKTERIKMVKAMEFIARQIPDEDILKTWIDYGVEDGDIEYGDLDSTIRDSGSDPIEKYISDDKLEEVMKTFIEVVRNAYNETIGLCCDGVQDYREEEYTPPSESVLFNYPNTENDAAMGNITGYMFIIGKFELRAATVPKSIESYKKLIGCDNVGFRRILLGTTKQPYGVFYDVDCKPWGGISGWDVHGNVMFHGNLFVVNVDNDNNVFSLTEDDFKFIRNCSDWYSSGEDAYPHLGWIEYADEQ